MVDKTSFGQRIKQRRLENEMTQYTLSTMLGIREADLRRWESGRNLPNAERLPDLADLL